MCRCGVRASIAADRESLRVRWLVSTADWFAPSFRGNPMRVRGLLPVAVLVLIGADDPAKDRKKELDLLQGEWALVSQESQGRLLPDALVRGQTVTVKADQWTIQVRGKEGTFTFKIDPSKDPKTIDLTRKVGEKEIVLRGIYKVDGDTLTVCRAGAEHERPKEFKVTAEVGLLQVWKRVKK